jgi:uncharacterized protein (DUF1800 family)
MRAAVHDDETRTRWDEQSAAHLLSRAAFGGTPEEVVRLAAMTRGQAVAALLEEAAEAPPPARPAWVKDPWVNTERRYADTPREVAAEGHRSTRRRYASELNALRSWWLGHMIRTEAPLRELMTLFWHGHFATATSKVMISQAIYQQNATLRRHALGDFRTLLRELTLDPAMMMFLDLEGSDKAKPNENYARELLELFTVGIGHYTERDIKETARALTGWTLDAPPGTPKKGKDAPTTPRDFARDGLFPTFVPARHDDGAKTIFGETRRFDLDGVIELLARHDATASFITGKLIAFFGVADESGALRKRLASSFVASKGQIQPVLRTLFTSPEFDSDASRGSQIKSPVRLLVGACRQLELEVEPTPMLAQLAAAMGQELFDPPNVKGWPGGRAWIGAGTLAVRYHLPEALIDGREPAGLEPLGFRRFLAVPRDAMLGPAMLARMEGAMAERSAQRRQEGLKCRFRPEALFPRGVPNEPSALVDAMLARLVVSRVRPSTRSTLIAACQAAAPPDRPAIVARMILASPEYQMA